MIICQINMINRDNLSPIKKTGPCANRDRKVTSENDTPNQQPYCIIFGQPLQENESSLAVIFVPNFKVASFIGAWIEIRKDDTYVD